MMLGLVLLPHSHPGVPPAALGCRQVGVGVPPASRGRRQAVPGTSRRRGHTHRRSPRGPRRSTCRSTPPEAARALPGLPAAGQAQSGASPNRLLELLPPWHGPPASVGTPWLGLWAPRALGDSLASGLTQEKLRARREERRRSEEQGKRQALDLGVGKADRFTKHLQPSRPAVLVTKHLSHTVRQTTRLKCERLNTTTCSMY